MCSSASATPTSRPETGNARIFAEASVRINWRTGRPSGAQSKREPAIMVSLTERTPADYLPDALAAARALAKHTKLSAKDIAQEAMRIASEICIFTNANFTVEEL